MTTQELRELDVWIAEHIFKCEVYKSIDDWRDKKYGYTIPSYCTTPAFAMDVLKKCAEKCGVRICHYKDRTPNVWDIYATDGRTAGSQAETIELAICLFAKQLFSQTTK